MSLCCFYVIAHLCHFFVWGKVGHLFQGLGNHVGRNNCHVSYWYFPSGATRALAPTYPGVVVVAAVVAVVVVVVAVVAVAVVVAVVVVAVVVVVAAAAAVVVWHLGAAHAEVHPAHDVA